MKRFLPVLAFLGLIASCTSPTSSNTWTLLPFEKQDADNPVLEADSTTLFHCPIRDSTVRWEAKDVFNPAAIVRNDTLFLLYRAEDFEGKYAGTSRIGLAWSLDGVHFTRFKTPVLYPDKDSAQRYEWEGGCEDPRVVEDETGRYILTYTAYDGDKARLMVATSNDLYHWEKKGPAFAKAFNGKYLNHWSKSGSIVSNFSTGKILATRINGRYQMYWGDTDIFLAESNDLVEWTPVEKKDGGLLSVFGPRKGKFDSDLVEPGPPALLTEKGILLLYNCRNVPSKGDTTLAEGTYAPAQILLDKNHPDQVLERMDHYMMKPEKPYEVNGQVNHVCFIEGLVRYKSNWFLYYGTADSRIAVAVKHSLQ